jgi:hypothetical protein
VDSGGFFALLVCTDAAHEKARLSAQQLRQVFPTVMRDTNRGPCYRAIAFDSKSGSGLSESRQVC